MNISLKAVLVVVLVSVYSPLSAQFQNDVYRQYDGTIVTKGTGDLPLAWSGGVNQPQIAMADLNRDGRNDIVLLETFSRIVKTYICTAPGKYKYNSWYERNFKQVQDYIKLIDFNGDKIADLIHHGQAGINVSYGYYEGNELRFRFYKELQYLEKNGFMWTPCYVARGDVPGMADVDGDGDIDIFAYRVGGTQITLYQNCTIEDNLPRDSIKICLKDWCWGRNYQGFAREQVLGLACPLWTGTCKGCPSPEAKGTHGSNTLCMIDIDSDGDLDFFNGNQDYEDIQFLYNGKSQYGVDSIVAQDTAWTSNGVTMTVPIFPGAYYLNVDHEGADDLLFTSTTAHTENYKSIVYYKNTGTNANKNFVYQTNTFLVDDMIDLGVGSYPFFYDYDKDGKKDLFIGSEGYYQSPGNYNLSRLSYYHNTTNTTTTPVQFSFEYVTDDFMGLGAKGYRGIAPAIGDINNDSLDDLILGHVDGTFSYFKNVAQYDTVAPVWELVTDTLKDNRTGLPLDVGDYSTPFLFDINGDGRKDLVSGNQLGQIHYIHNYSTFPGAVGLEHKTDSLGGVGIKDLYEPYTYSTPYLGPTDDDGNNYLVVGTQWGALYRYSGLQNGPFSKYSKIDSVYSYIDVGIKAAPAFANIDNDSKGLHELVIGNELGGVVFYKQDFKVGINDVNAVEQNVKVYPNPASGTVNITWDAAHNVKGVTVQLLSVTGQVITQQTYGDGVYSATLSLDKVAAGVYYCVVQTEAGRVVKPVSVIK